jgi:hypothetical protein
MVHFILATKQGSFKQGEVKDADPATFEKELYSKCGYRAKTEKSMKEFKHLHTWKVKDKGVPGEVRLYGKEKGAAGSENKCNFPPSSAKSADHKVPNIDTHLLFGDCGIVMWGCKQKKYEDLSLEKWNKIYERLFGGFDNMKDTEEEDENEEDELQAVPKDRKSRGYLKDGFVVSDSEDDDSSSDDDTDDDVDDVDDDDDDSDISDADADANADADADADVDADDECAEKVESDDDVDDDDDEDDDSVEPAPVKKRKPAAKRGTTVSKKKPAGIDFAELEKNDLVLEQYLPSDNDDDA